jgi:hypothetical protein
MTPDARREAELSMDTRGYGNSQSGIAAAIGVTGRRIGWALLDVADAIREANHKPTLDELAQHGKDGDDAA